MFDPVIAGALPAAEQMMVSFYSPTALLQGGCVV
jgi:hypothetical protein